VELLEESSGLPELEAETLVMFRRMQSWLERTPLCKEKRNPASIDSIAAKPGKGEHAKVMFHSPEEILDDGGFCEPELECPEERFCAVSEKFPFDTLCIEGFEALALSANKIGCVLYRLRLRDHFSRRCSEWTAQLLLD